MDIKKQDIVQYIGNEEAVVLEIKLTKSELYNLTMDIQNLDSSTLLFEEMYDKLLVIYNRMDW